MSKRKTILILAVCFSTAVFTVQTQSRTSDSERLRNMSEAERKREAAKRRRQKKLESEQERRRWELGREQRRLDREQRRKEAQERLAKIKKEFLMQKSALKATEEQWKVIKSKLEKVRYLRDLECSTVNLNLTSSSGSRSVPMWKWRTSWKDKAPAELTEAQKLANELIALVEKKNTTPEAFKKKMVALRESRRRQEKLRRQLSQAREELREVLTVRQEASLVLMGWL